MKHRDARPTSEMISWPFEATRNAILGFVVTPGLLALAGGARALALR